MMTRERKAEEIAGISERFGKSKAAFLVDFKGLSVEKVTNLRKSLASHEAEMKVVRNTLALRALKDYPEMESVLTDKFVGTNAIIFAYGDAVSPAKALSDFAKEAEELQIKTGVMDGKGLSEAQIKYLATLPGKDQLRAQLLGLFNAPMGKFLGTLQAVPGGFARLLGAYRDSKNG
jgi:large subunit ribosomal protein L10